MHNQEFLAGTLVEGSVPSWKDLYPRGRICTLIHTLLVQGPQFIDSRDGRGTL